MEKHNSFKINFEEREDFNFKGLDITSYLIIDEALKRGIKARFVLNKYVLLESGGRRHLFHNSDNTSLPAITKQILCSKTETKEILRKKGINVPEGRRFNSSDSKKIFSYTKKINGKMVIKPDNTDYGKDVYSKIGKRESKEAVDKISRGHEELVVEKFRQGNEYRVFITKNGFCAVCMRRPANVWGDGKSSVKELINKKNMGRQNKKELPRKLPWFRIETDNIALNCLEKQGLSLDSVPKKDERIYLRFNSNICSGGDSIEMTDEAHESVKEIAMKVLDSIPGLTYAGIDLITRDITRNIGSRYTIIEVNNMPGIPLHHYPYIGNPKNVAGALIDLVFPETKK